MASSISITLHLLNCGEIKITEGKWVVPSPKAHLWLTHNLLPTDSLIPTSHSTNGQNIFGKVTGIPFPDSSPSKTRGGTRLLFPSRRSSGGPRDRGYNKARRPMCNQQQLAREPPPLKWNWQEPRVGGPWRSKVKVKGGPIHHFYISGPLVPSGNAGRQEPLSPGIRGSHTRSG